MNLLAFVAFSGLIWVPSSFMAAAHSETRSDGWEGQPMDFKTTHWSVVMLAGRENSQGFESALGKLFGQYWLPVYFHARRFGLSTDDAKDATQGFFHHLLASNGVVRADREKGRFRSFLLTSFKNFLGNQHQKSRAAKRGGGVSAFSLDEKDAEDRYLHEPAHGESPDVQFDRQFAISLLESALKRQEAEWAAAGKAAQFAALKPHLTSVSGKGVSSELCEKLGQTSGTALVTLSRARGRFRELFRNEVMQTVTSQAEFEDEMRYLVGLFGG